MFSTLIRAIVAFIFTHKTQCCLTSKAVSLTHSIKIGTASLWISAYHNVVHVRLVSKTYPKKNEKKSEKKKATAFIIIDIINIYQLIL